MKILFIGFFENIAADAIVHRAFFLLGNHGIGGFLNPVMHEFIHISVKTDHIFLDCRSQIRQCFVYGFSGNNRQQLQIKSVADTGADF